jgi:hypothetical protein
VSGQLHTPATLPPGKEPPVPIGYEAGRAPEPVWVTWRIENSWPYCDLDPDPLVIQPLASYYTDCAIPALSVFSTSLKSKTGREHEKVCFSRIKPHMLIITDRTFTSIRMCVHDSNKYKCAVKSWQVFCIRLVLSGVQPFILTGLSSFQTIIISSDPWRNLSMRGGFPG